MSGDGECEEGLIGICSEVWNYSNGNLTVNVQSDGIEIEGPSPFMEIFVFVMLIVLAFVVCIGNGGRHYYAVMRARRVNVEDDF